MLPLQLYLIISALHSWCV
uniref:Uncharacterized protein n=1 Tax=Anguilla anguilla TaxID=7936 RepID=A0A0E9T4Y5_ANGAN